MPLTEPQQRILARKLALHRAAFGPVTDGRRLVDEAWGEQTGEELREITALYQHAFEFGVPVDAFELERIFTGFLVRHALSNVTDSELMDEANDVADRLRDAA